MNDSMNNEVNTDMGQARSLYVFTDPKAESLFVKITQELRCSVCQNQMLSDSMAPLAVDLRGQIYQQIQSQRSEKEIIQYVTDRYGDFVLYKPPIQWNTAVLWFGPVVILALGFMVLIKQLKAR